MKNSAPKRHARMVDDARRTAPLLAAVKGAVKAGDIVLDIGTGTGLLAVAAAKAGASRVLAVDCDAEALDSARASAEKASVDDVITFVEGLSFDTKLKRRADVVLCETVGSFAFDENILATLSDAKRRLLKSGGLIVPATLELWGSPISRLPKIKPPSDTGRTKKEDMLSAPSRLAGIDFSKFIPPELHMKPQCKCTSKGTVLGIAVWPKVTWFGKETTDASPLKTPTHWGQGILPIEPREVKAGERISFELVIRPHPDDPKRMTERLWRWS